MKKKQSNKPLRIDLSRKTPAEIADFLHTLLSARHVLLNTGHSLHIERRQDKPALVNKNSQVDR